MIERLVRNGNLRAVLPGVYAEPGTCESIRTRMHAVMQWDRDAVVVGAAAAWVSFWPEIRVSHIACSLRHQRRPQAGNEFTRRRIPPELVISRSGLRYTSPALTALDLCETFGGDGIDQALRTRATTLALLHQAMELTAGRIGIKPGASSYSILVKRRGRRQSASAEVFESDRWRQNLLILDGWCVLRFTWTMIEEHPERVVAMVRDAIRMLSNLKA
jgi:hypothetical protein